MNFLLRGRGKATETPPAADAGASSDSTAGQQEADYKVTKDHWKPDESRQECARPGCGLKFTWGLEISRRRHHCRCCGDVFCSKCVGFSRRLDRNAKPHPHGVWSPVCEKCFSDGKAQELGEVRDLTGSFFRARDAESRRRSASQRLLLSRLSVLTNRVADPNKRDAACPWVPDAQQPRCFRCSEPFPKGIARGTIAIVNPWAKRRHHCRLCGALGCGECVSESAPLGRSEFLPTGAHDPFEDHLGTEAANCFASAEGIAKYQRESVKFGGRRRSSAASSDGEGGVKRPVNSGNVRICKPCRALLDHLVDNMREHRDRVAAEAKDPAAHAARIIANITQDIDEAETIVAEGGIEGTGKAIARRLRSFAEGYAEATKICKSLPTQTVSQDVLVKAMLAKLAWLSSERLVPLRGRLQRLGAKIDV